MTKRLTTLERLAELSSISYASSVQARDDERPLLAANYSGKAAAYSTAHDLMKGELERLRNMLQNGSLTVADFNEVLGD